MHSWNTRTSKIPVIGCLMLGEASCHCSHILGAMLQMVYGHIMQTLWNCYCCKIMIRSSYKLAHVTTAELSWHVQIRDLTGWFERVPVLGSVSPQQYHLKPSWNTRTSKVPVIGCLMLGEASRLHLDILQAILQMTAHNPNLVKKRIIDLKIMIGSGKKFA